MQKIDRKPQLIGKELGCVAHVGDKKDGNDAAYVRCADLPVSEHSS